MSEHVKGRWQSPTYRSWSGMVTRCTNPKRLCFKHYGARGISVCDRWLVFASFLADMGVRPEGMTLDRADVNGNYEPANCRWLPAEQQAWNRRDTKNLTFNGVTQPQTVWARQLGMPLATIRTRLKRGYSVADALTLQKGGHRAGFKHGTVNGYRIHRCRCDDCRAASSAAWLKWDRKRRANLDASA